MPKIYTMKHTSQHVLNIHKEKIKQRGGKFEVGGMTIKYWFPQREPSGSNHTEDKEKEEKYKRQRHW